MFYPDVDLATGIDYFGSPQSFALVSGFSGAALDDIDTDDDGVADSTPWSSIIATVTLDDDDGTPSFNYVGGDVVVNTGSTFTPSHAWRFPNSTGPWNLGVFDNADNDTPGVANVPEPTSMLMMLVSLLGLQLVRRK